jgi:hypothetical protein
VTYLRASSSRFWASQLFAKWSCIGFKQQKTVQPLVRKFNSNTKSVKVVSIEFSTMFKAKKWLQKLNNAQNMKTISSHWIYNHLIKLFIQFKFYTHSNHNTDGAIFCLSVQYAWDHILTHNFICAHKIRNIFFSMFWNVHMCSGHHGCTTHW